MKVEPESSEKGTWEDLLDEGLDSNARKLFAITTSNLESLRPHQVVPVDP